MGGQLYFSHEIDSNPTASNAGTIKACATMVTWRDNMDDSVRTFSVTWLVEDVIEDEGLSSKLEELNELFMEAGFPHEPTLLLMTEEVNRRVIELTSSGDYSTDFALSLWFTFRVRLPPHSVDDFDQIEAHDETKIRPAGKLVVKSLTRKIYNKTSSLVGDNCTICLEEFKNGERLVILPCGHEFDDECIVDWFTTRHFCPLCRFELPHEDQ